jgi:hypothetical protein
MQTYILSWFENENISVANNSFENVTKFKYWGRQKPIRSACCILNLKAD